MAVVQLVPMTDAVYQMFRVHTIRAYAQEKVQAGAWANAGALARAEEEFARLLPQGKDTPNHYLYSIVTDQDMPVGILWFAVRDSGAGPVAFVFDIEIHPEQRRQGYAAQALQALETNVQDLGLSRIELHVFGHNKAAQGLYSKAGFVVTDLSMAKSLQ